MTDTIATDPLVAQRQALEAQLADVTRQEATKDAATISELKAAFADPGVVNLIKAVESAPTMYDPARAAQVSNIARGLGAMRDVIIQFDAQISKTLGSTSV